MEAYVTEIVEGGRRSACGRMRQIVTSLRASVGRRPARACHALTGTALAARTEEDSRLRGDVGMMGYLKGCVRGRTLRLGKTPPLFDGARGATGFAGMDYHPGLPRFAPEVTWESAAMAPDELTIIAAVHAVDPLGHCSLRSHLPYEIR